MEEVYGGYRPRISPGPQGVAGRAGLWAPASRPRGSPGGAPSPAAPPPEALRRRLVRALQRAVAPGGSRRAREAEAAAAREERGRARVESALSRLRAELLEMRFQNRQLARTLLDVNMKMQLLRKEHELHTALEFQKTLQ